LDFDFIGYNIFSGTEQFVWFSFGLDFYWFFGSFFFRFGFLLVFLALSFGLSAFSDRFSFGLDSGFSQFGFRLVSQDSVFQALSFRLYAFSFSDHSRASTIQRCDGFYASHSLFDRGSQSFDFWDFYVDKRISGYLNPPGTRANRAFQTKGFHVVPWPKRHFVKSGYPENRYILLLNIA